MKNAQKFISKVNSLKFQIDRMNKEIEETEGEDNKNSIRIRMDRIDSDWFCYYEELIKMGYEFDDNSNLITK